MNKKRLLYITRYRVDKPFNLQKKFDGQMAAFRNLGFDVFFIGFDSKHLYLINNDVRKEIGKAHMSIPHYEHTMFYYNLNNAAIKALNEYNFDVVYWRSAPVWKSNCKAAKAIKDSGAEFILEIPTFPPNQEKQLSAVRNLFEKYSKKYCVKFQSYIDRYVVIGEDAHGKYLGKPAINIENGIDLSNIKIRVPKHKDNTIHILALASMNYWHGYDRLINSLAQYNGNTEVVIHLVGDNEGGALTEWQELVKNKNLSEKVIFHGRMDGVKLEEMFNLCDIGVNSLGMYRKGFDMTMELKTREYTARGLPFVCAVNDPSLQFTDKPLWLRIPNDDSIPSMQMIVDFALKMREDSHTTEKLRDYAEKYMTWESQYKKVFDKIGG